MAKTKKIEPVELLANVEVTMVVQQKGQEPRHQNVIYKDGLEMRKTFAKKGYRVQFFQLGFYQPPKK